MLSRFSTRLALVALAGAALMGPATAMEPDRYTDAQVSSLELVVGCDGIAGKCWTVDAAPSLSSWLVSPAQAEEAVTPTPSPAPAPAVTPAPQTAVNLGPLYDAFLAYIVPGLGTLIALLFSWLALVAKQKFNLQIDDSLRAGAQTALQNAAAGLIVKLKGVLPATLDVRNPYVREAMDYVITASPDWMKRFGLGPDDVRDKLEKVVAKTIIQDPTIPTLPAIGAAAASIPKV